MPKTKRNKPYKPKPIARPFTQAMIDHNHLIALGNLTALKIRPNVESFDRLAGIIDMLTTALSKRDDLKDYLIIFNSAALALVGMKEQAQKTGNIFLSELNYCTIKNAVNIIDQVLSRLNTREIEEAELQIRKGL